MPYESKAQAAYMHIHHPDIAAKWHEKGHGYVKTHKVKGKMRKLQHKSDVSKSKKDWAQALAVGTAGGALANQIPTVKAESFRRKKKGKVKKAWEPPTGDPYFNQAAAQKTFDLIMKMDDDTAEMFSVIVAADLLEREQEQNLRTLQKHLDEVIVKQLSDLKKAAARAIVKGASIEDADRYAEAITMLEEQISKANPADIPDWQFERKINRDPSSGRFRTKITQSSTKKPIDDKTAANLGMKQATKDPAYQALSSKEKAKFQNEYLQVSRFIDAVNAGTGEKAKMMAHFKDEKTGETWVDHHTSGKPPIQTMLQPDVTITGMEALPEALTVGGAAFSLSGAMGGQQLHPRQVEQINAFDAKYGQPGNNAFANQWMSAGNAEHQNANSRLYQRTTLLGGVAGTVAPDGSKLQLAGKMADIVGQYGPQAEQVLGPSARKTAYRYRGTERAPDKKLVRAYAAEIERNKKYGPIDPWEAREEARGRAARRVQTPFGPEVGGRAPAGRPSPTPSITPSISQMARERLGQEGRAPEWKERELGREAVAGYLRDRLPTKQYYKLHLNAGNTPPSEGVIINANGQIVTQASGYGDDHYLPFNLKNLKGLKGGEYVRSRSVGGLTSEDIYTGLITGARRVTVVSRSGTFTMEFQEDFRGGRRHNDKARRMTRRYEQILDAVQSEQVERAEVPTRWKNIIAEEVRGEYPPTTSNRIIRAEIDARLKDFKEDPQIDGRDLDRAEAAIRAIEAQAESGEVTRQDAADYRKEVMGDLRDLKEIHFRLNGVGYQAALDSLEEQFPYYIHSMSRPKEEHLQEFERDLGYVEPARNRPTAASAGWFGTAGKEASMKYSAAHANYQRGLAGAPAPPRAPGTVSTTASAGKTPGTTSERDKRHEAVQEAAEKAVGKRKAKEAAVELHMAAKQSGEPPKDTPEWWHLDRDDFRAYIETPDNLTKFNGFVEQNHMALNKVASSRLMQYRNAVGAISAKPYDPAVATIVPPQPYTFKDSGKAYKSGASAEEVALEIHRLDGQDIGLVHNKALSELSDAEMREEVGVVADVKSALADAPVKLSGDEALQEFGSYFGGSAGSAFVGNLFKKGGLDEHLKRVHQMRYLKARSQRTNPGGGPTGGGGGSAGFTPPSGGGGTPPPPANQPAAPKPPAPAGPRPGTLVPRPNTPITPPRPLEMPEHSSEAATAMATSDDPEQKRRLYLMRAWSAQTEAEKEGDDNLAQRIDDFRTNLKAAPKFEDMDQFQAHISDVDQSLLTEMLARQPKPTKPNPT